jgi:hypothetical protein
VKGEVLALALQLSEDALQPTLHASTRGGYRVKRMDGQRFDRSFELGHYRRAADIDEVIRTVIQIGITHENSHRARTPQPLRRYRQMDRRR